MNQTATCAALTIALTAAIGAAETPSLDLLGEAAFTDNWLSVSISSATGEVRDSGRQFDALRLGVGAYSVSGYSSRERKDAGGLLGGALLARAWFASDNDVDYTAVAPALVLIGGGYWKPSNGLRFDLTGEAGPGLSFSRTDNGTDTTTEVFRPALHAGVHGTARTRIRQDMDLGVTVGYEYDRLPQVTIDGPLIALSFIWHPSAEPAPAAGR